MFDLIYGSAILIIKVLQQGEGGNFTSDADS